MSKYPAGLLAVVNEAPGKEYSIKREDLEVVLQYLEAFSLHPAQNAQVAHPSQSRELVAFVDKKEYALVLWTLRGSRRKCVDHHAGADRITLELHADCYRVDPSTVPSTPVPIRLYTKNLLIPEAGSLAKQAIAANAAEQATNAKGV